MTCGNIRLLVEQSDLQFAEASHPIKLGLWSLHAEEAKRFGNP
jgi:hypothetical protein